MGTNNIDNGSRLLGTPTHTNLGQVINPPGIPNNLDSLEQSDVILIIGADVEISAPIISYSIKRAVKQKNTKLLLVDPRQTKLSSFAHLWLKPQVGTDVALINGLTKVIVDEGLLDKDSVTGRADNFEAFNESLAQYVPEYVEKITGVSRQEIQLAARLFAQSSRAAFVYGNGITQQPGGTEGITALANLALLVGCTGNSHGSIFRLQRENNAQGACDMGTIPDFLPGYQNVQDTQARKKFEERWQVSLPNDGGLTALEMMEQIKAGEIKGMFIMGENPVLSFPHSALVREALSSLELLVVSDLFLTETAELAAVVLPAASFAEKDGTFTNFEGRVQRVQKAIEPVGESLPDWEIILQLAKAMDCPMPYSSPQEVMNEIKELVPLYRGESSRGFGHFVPVKYGTPVEPTKNYPFTLLAGSTLYQFGSGTRSSRSWRLKIFSPEAFVGIGNTDARQLGLMDGDKVKVISPVDEITVTTRITDTLLQGMLFMPISFPESPASKLFDIILEPKTKSPSLKACAVRLERVDNDD
jgi:predicted molibdopterin-dependent oxidoreductase YjgC